MKNPVGILFALVCDTTINQSHEKRPGRNIPRCTVLDGLYLYVIIPIIFSGSLSLKSLRIDENRVKDI
jgi:hypothetical protein